MLVPVKVIKGFKCWNTGDTAGFLEAEVVALERANHVVRIDPKTGEPIAKPEPAGAPAPVGMDADEIVIPENWADQHHLIIIALAKKIDETVKTKVDAIAVIEAELERRAGADGDAASETTKQE